jgi:hypothetical protein
VHSHAGPFWPFCASPLNPLLSQSQSPPMLAGHRCTLESDISKFLFNKCRTTTLKAEYAYTLSCISQLRYQKTLLRYNAHWFRFRSWCQQNKLLFLPADPMHVAIFLSNSLRFALSRGLTYSTIKPISLRLSSMYCSGQVPFLPSLSLKILVGEGRIPGQARFSLIQEGFF